ncbi:MAG: LamG domain protein jellyroll fold domain protein [Acidobacteria bacterium]|nr:LamG domain protein jellyroll fold domain protein [Acidobacteriota bacterium]
MLALIVCGVASVRLGAAPAAAAQAQGRFVAKEDILLFGLTLHVECNPNELPDAQGQVVCQTVPKGFATAVPTMFVAPQLPENIPTFGPDAIIMGTLRGPSFPTPLELTAKPNTPFSIPAMSVAGKHSLDDIRLVSNGQVLLRGDRESVIIDVIDKLLVTQVTARPLTAAEEREKGLVFDKTNFQAYNFSAAFAIGDTKVPVNFTVVLPTLQGADDLSATRVVLPGIGSEPGLPSLQTVIPDSLKQLSLQIPNLTMVGFSLKIPEMAGQNFFVPPIPGVIVIPGDIGFLNQFFSVMLMVGNVAPAGSNLVVTDLTAEIVLPPGDDNVVGSPDDPLAMGHTEKGDISHTQPVVQPGADGRLGTADDIKTIGPGETGNAEYLIEGRREGTHIVEMRLSGTLLGLPIGPVPVTGIARGAVLVRNPNFTLTFTHPEVVSAGEKYSLDVTITNTSASPANLVSLNLYPQFVTGATILGDPTRQIDSIAPGDSSTVTFELVARVSGKVFATNLSSDDNVAGRFKLKTSVGELGVPLSPDTLVLPKEAGSLPPSLRDAALGLLGKAYAVATAPPAALPKDVSRFSKKLVFDHAIEVAEAGLRVTLHEPTGDSALQLLMDFMGSNVSRLPQLIPTPEDAAAARVDYAAFDDLRRRSVRGDVLAQAVASLLQPSLASGGAAAFHLDVARKISYRPGHISVIVDSGAQPLPVALTLLDAQGRRLGGVDAQGKFVKQISFGDYLQFANTNGAATGQLAMLSAPDAGDFRIHLEKTSAASADATFTLSIVLPDAAGNLRQLLFANVSASQLPTLSVDPNDPYRLSIEVAANGVPAAGAPVAPALTAIADPPPSIIGAVQLAQADQVCVDPGKTLGLWAPGRVMAVLFSEEVSAQSVQDKFSPDKITNYVADGNQVVGVALQPDRRIVFLGLRDPVGPYVPRTLTVSDVTDLRGQPIVSAPMPIESTVDDAAGVVSGRVLHADGTPVPFANVRLFYPCPAGESIVWIGISSKSANANGQYGWDYVLSSPRIVAIDPETEDSRDLQFRIGHTAQRLNVDIVMLGRGSLQGRTVDEAGKPLKDSAIRVSSLTDNSVYSAKTDAAGHFSIARVPVGPIFIEAVNPDAQAQFSVSEVIPFAGATTTRELVLLRADSPKQAAVKKGTLSGHVVRTDKGSTADLPVIVYYETGSQPGVFCPGSGVAECAVALGKVDADGGFTFAGVPAGGLHVRSFDQATLQQGDATTALPIDGTASLTVILQGGLGSVKGVVLDPAGKPVPGARVGGGLSLAVTDAAGRFTLTDVPLGLRSITAVSDALQSSATAQVNLVRVGEEVPLTLVLDSVASVAGTVFHVDGSPAANISVYLFKSLPSGGGIAVLGPATSDPNGHYQIAAVPLGDYKLSAFTSDFTDGNFADVSVKFNKQVVKADVTFRGGNGGRVTGTILDTNGQTPLKGRVSISGDQAVVAGGRVAVRFEYVQNSRIVDTDLSGQFSLGGIWPGAFTVRAAGVFSPDPISLEGVMPVPTATVQMNIRLEPTSQLHGTIFQKNGVTPVAAGVPIHYHSTGVQVFCSELSSGESSCISIPKGIQDADAVTQDDGTFLFATVTAGPFTVTIDEPSGHPVRVAGTARPGERMEISARLPAVADVIVRVFTSDLKPVPGAKVDITQLDFPCPPSGDCTNRSKRSFAGGTQPGEQPGIAQFTGGDAVIEGAFVVMAVDVNGNGAAGRASGKVKQDGNAVTVDLFLYSASGVVSGTVRRPDGQPAPNAEVVIANQEGPLTLTVTDAAGAFRQELIPINKPFTIEAFDPVTAARGFGSGTIFVAGQEVPVFIDEDPLAVVTGHLVEIGTLAPLKGWQVSFSQTAPSGRQVSLRTMTAVDGSFSFPGAAVGPFVLSADKKNIQATATANGTVDHGGQAVDVSVVATISRPSFGRLQGTVFNADGTPAGDAQVDVCFGTLCPPAAVTVTADHASGAFSVEHVPLGRVIAVARTQDGLQTGSALSEVVFDGQTAQAQVVLAGISSIGGTVTFADGRPAVHASLFLNADPFLQRQRGVDPDTATFSFSDVSANSFTITATDAVSGLKGAASDVLHAGENKQVQIVLQPTGSLSAVVQLESGNPAVGVSGELLIGGHHFFAQSGATGSISFDTVPLGDYSLTLQDPLGIGIAKRVGTVAGPVSLNTITLDSSRPVVAQVTPAAATTGVSHDQSIAIVFSEPVDVCTVTTANIIVGDASGVTAGTVVLSDGDRTATFKPLDLLKDQTKYNVRVTGVTDLVGHTMSADFVTSFTTADIAPPTIVALNPAPGTSGVNIFSPISITFSEAIDLVKFRGPPSLVVTSPTGAVAGRTDFLLGGTVAVFTPNLPLAQSTSYHVQAPAAIDLAGNAAAQATDYTFTTTNFSPPAVTALVASNAGKVIENTVATVTASVDTGHDISFVDFFLNDVFSGTARGPFTFSFQAIPALGVPGDQIKVSAVATDTSGARGIVPAVAFVTILADTPPTIAITAPPAATSAANGQRVDVTVKTTDDVGIQQVSFRAQTGKPLDAATHVVSPTATGRTDLFGFNVPDDAVPGSTIAIDATVKDTKGQTSTSAASITVTDSVAPVVTITGATTGDRIRPGQQTTVVVSAQDAGAVRAITFKAGGVAILTQTRVVDPAQTSVAASFTLTIPAGAHPPDSLTLDATAIDRAGNVGIAARVILPVADTAPPSVTSIRTSTGKLQITAGSTVTVLADASDDIGVSRIDLVGAGAFAVVDGRQILPPLVTGSASFTIHVPPGALPGSVLLLTATATDLAGNASATASLGLTVIALSDVTLPPSSILEAGTSQDVVVQLSGPAPAGGTRVDFATDPGIASVTPFITIPSGQTTGAVSIAGVAGGTASIAAKIAGVTRGSMTVTVIGGIVRGLVLDSQLAPVAGASLTVIDASGSGSVTTTSDATGAFKVTGIGGPFVTVKALKDVDATTRLLGFVNAQMNQRNGFATVNVVLLAAGVIHGTALQADGQTPVGAGVRVDLFEATDLLTPIASQFTAPGGAFEFPLVAIGQYSVGTSDNAGNRGRAPANVAGSGQDVEVVVSFLGSATVAITVKDGGGNLVPGANVSLYGFNIFGAAPVITRTADGNGQAVFQNVSVGTFRSDAQDPITGRGGSTGGEVAANLQPVFKQITLAAFGSVNGTVYRPDGTTPVSGALVTAAGLSTTTDTQGRYALTFVPLGTLTVTARDEATRDFGTSQPVFLNVQGAASTADVTLLAQGTLVITVTDAGGTPVKGATVLVGGVNGGSGQTGDAGVVIIEHVIAGAFTVDALFGSLHGSAPGVLAANEQKAFLVRLPPTASIAGVVKAANDAPADAGKVFIDGTFVSSPIAADGTFRFDGLLLGNYTLSAYDAAGRLRAHTKTPIALLLLNQVAQTGLNFVGLGTVGGRVVNPDGSSAQDVSVQIRSLNAEFGRFASTSTNAGGIYTVADLPVGDVTVSAANPTLHLRAEGSGTIGHDGDTIPVNLILENNLIDLPTTRWDANNFLFDLQKDGSVLHGTNDVFSALYAGKTWGGMQLDVIAGGTPTRFTGGDFGTVEEKNREIVIRQDDVAGLSVTRKVFVPATGYFARYLETLTNPTDLPVTVDVRVSSHILRHNGSDLAPEVFATSSGDDLLDVADPSTRDRWVAIDDQGGDPFVSSGLPATAFVFDGVGGARAASSALFAASDPQVFRGPRELDYQWSAITVPPRGTVALMHFVVQETTRPAAQAAAERLLQLPPEALAGLSLEELVQVENFAAPSDGVSTVAPMAPLTGTVTGRVFASDGTTPAAGVPVWFQSGNPLFRSYQTTTAADGGFTFASVLTENGTSQAIPIEGFTLSAYHPVIGGQLPAPPAAGVFAAGSDSAQRDVLFSSTGILKGIVRLNGAPVTRGQISAGGVFGTTGMSFSIGTANDGSYVFPLMPPTVFTLSAIAFPPAGAVEARTAVTVVAGQTIITDVDIDTVAPLVSIASPAPNASIDPRNPLAVTVQVTDAGGVADVSLAASGVATFAETRTIAPTATSRAEVFSVPFALLPMAGGTVTLTATARDRAGNQASAAPVTVTVRDVVSPDVVLVSPAAGTVEVEPTTNPVVRFSEPIARASVTSGSLTLSSGGTPIPVSYLFAEGDRAVTMVPAQPLALNRTFTIVATPGIIDIAGNALTARLSSAFRTKSPDTTPPRVSAIVPANGAANVPVGADVEIAFTEPLARTTITSSTFRVSIGGSPVAGHFAFANADAIVRFVPDTPLPFDAIVLVQLTSAITDVWDNALVDGTGQALTVPLTFTFATGTFGITSPAAGTEVLESSSLLLQVKASPALTVATVTFTVNGTVLPAAAGPPFTTTFAVGTAATMPTLTIVAVGRDASGAQVAQDQVIVPVAVGLQAGQRLVGVALGGSSTVRLFLPSPIATDLQVQLTAVDGTIAAPAVASAVIPAGETDLAVPVTGLAAGATTIVATSSRGTAWAIASVSAPVAKTMPIEASDALVAVIPRRSLGQVFLAAGRAQTIPVALLSAPAGADTPVTISSSNAGAVSVAGDVVIAAGSQIANVPITAGGAATATLTLRAGNEISQLTLVVGPPFAGAPPVVSKPVGFVTLTPPTLGRVFAPVGAHSTINLRLLTVAAAADTAVSVASSNPSVASVAGAVTVAAGSQRVSFDLTTGVEGTATLTLRTATDVRLLTVFVGTAPPDVLPVTVAEPVGIVTLQPPLVGRVFGAVAGHTVVTVRLLSAPATVATPVTVVSSNPSVVAAAGTITIAAGSQTATLDLANGIEGTAILTFRAAGEVRQLSVVVGTPPAGTVPVVIAPPVGVTLLQQLQRGHVFSPVGGQSSVTLTLLASAANVDTPVFITSSDASVAGVGPALIAAGSRSATIHIQTGVQGVATLTLHVGNSTGQLVVVVGTPPAALLPIITAPIVGLEIHK